VAERTRSELRPTLVPADDAALGDEGGALTGDVIAFLELRILCGAERRDDLSIGRPHPR
jgi:hypothetical protein